MTTNRVLIVIVTLSICSEVAYSQNKLSILDLIEQSIPKRESGWKLKSSNRMDGNPVPQAAMDWTNGKDEIGAYIFVFSSPEGAASNLKADATDTPYSKLYGIGDEAYLWTPEENKKYTLPTIRFRKSGAVVMMSSNSTDVVQRGAKSIANSIPPLDQYLQIVPKPQTQGDICHVYVVDVAKAEKAFDEYRDTGNPQADNKALAAAQTTFPEFATVIGEEELTTKTYPFPHSNLIITASIYYTDESMASSKGVDSMLVGVVVSPKAQKDAVSAEDNAVSESTLNGRDTVRVKKHLKVNGRLYLVGVECKGKGVNDLQ
jgi:hypothetical protein